MYSVSDVVKGIKQPYLMVRELNALLKKRFRSQSYNPRGIDVFGEDWDNLIILDACRYDVFADQVDLPGKLEWRESRAAATPEFIRGNFANRELHDTVYVTGNSWIFKQDADSKVYLVYDVVKHPEGNMEKPTLITECAKKAAEKHPDKRLVVHYIRPHHPFIGPTAEKYFSGLDDQPSDLYNRIQIGDINISDNNIRTLYEENLDMVLPRVKELLDSLTGKTVITADHGELLGERAGPIPIKMYGHTPGLYVEELTKVPWHIYENGERREISEDDPIVEPDSSYAVHDKSVDERLRDLGYKV